MINKAICYENIDSNCIRISNIVRNDYQIGLFYKYVYQDTLNTIFD